MNCNKEKLRSFFLEKTKFKRTIFYIVIDGVLLTLSLYCSFLLRFDGVIEPQYSDRFYSFLGIFLLVKYSVFTWFRLYRMNWSMVGFYEFLDILRANTVSLLFLMGIVLILLHESLFKVFPHSILLIDFGVSLVFIAMFRSSRRVFMHVLNGKKHSDAKRTLIVGAGNAGEQIAREMRRNSSSPYVPIGFIDDDPMKKGDYIQGAKVCGNRYDIGRLVKEIHIDLVLFAMPSVKSNTVRTILDLVHKAGVRDVKTIPGLDKLLNREIHLSDIKDVQIEDLIGREQVTVDKRIVGDFIRGRKILITGAGGSIGSELVRQTLHFNPELIIALDNDETELFRLEFELKHTSQARLIPVVADVRDKNKMQSLCDMYLPQLVFHAAAYKHVPMMEKYPEEAVLVNIFGTKNVAEAAVACGAEKFVLVSTDKAVKPTNVMGATKQVAEKIINHLNSFGITKCCSVRFGNVVGSRGSVLNIFKKQILSRSPVTVTHDQMKRYFMSIREACILILQSAAISQGGEVLHLDMGEQIKIMDIACELIKLHGFEPHIDIPISITGIREGEKLYEELVMDSEYSVPTDHPKIFKVRDTLNDYAAVFRKVMLFHDIIKNGQWAWIRNLLFDLVPTYKPSYNALDMNAVNEYHDETENSKLGVQ